MQARIGGREIRDEQETHEVREIRETRGELEDLARVRVGHDERTRPLNDFFISSYRPKYFESITDTHRIVLPPTLRVP